MPRRPRSAPKRAQTAVNSALRRAGLEHMVQQADVVAAWPRVVGKVMAAHTWVEVIRDGELVVATDHPAWRQELHWRSAEVLAALGRVLRGAPLRALSTVLRPRPADLPAPPAPEAPADPRAEGFGREVAAGIADPVLREALGRAAAAFARSRYRGRLGGDP
ncbi:MAG: DUF721 domain-containing protein [Deltaproteobacteria bacterium]|nr:DUF721 domain-containing protein [Deltaproteobacteria bacterium]